MNDEFLVPKPTICRLNLDGNPIEILIEENANHNPEETAALCAFLRAFSSIGSLGNCFDKKLHPTVQHELIFNLAGRRLQRNRALSLSVWPIVLARRWTASWKAQWSPTEVKMKVEWSKEDAATGIYYLLRHEPDLFDKRKIASAYI